MSSNCQTTSSSSILCHPAPQLQAILFFFSLYLIAIAQGMHKPCIHAFGADQFDASDTEECKSKSSFFNWCNASDCLAITITYFTLTYIQDNLSWGLGFGIPCLAVVFALVWFLLGTFTYRFHTTNNDDQGQGKSEPFSRIGRVFIKAAKNWRTISCAEDMDAENQGQGFPNSGSQEFRFLNKALLSSDGTMEEGHVCSINEVEEAKAILRLVPIWCSCLAYGIVFSQASTLFTKQGLTMERFITSTIQIPAASLQSFTSITIIVSLCIYDRILVPTARAITGKTSGITMLQRIGTGIFFSFLCVLAAALVEKRRLEVIEEFDLVDLPDATVPMSVAWLLPQYLLLGVSCTFTVTGLQQFFYDQMPNELRSTGLAISFTAIGLGELLSSLLISVIQKITGGLDEHGNPWISDNPMKGHVDYFYWLLVGLSALSFVAFLYFAKGYTYRNQ
ncbi:OLC1v1015757C2 [Oldenlandia corymbosa var. corymbosa]|nr:OLC1v1015757C2 [Oldenlandia corymbosa var. corymbosa]